MSTRLEVMAALKAGTHGLHEQLDRHSPMRELMSPDLSLGRYAQLLTRMLLCQRAVESALERAALADARILLLADPAVWRRRQALEQDLVALGQAPIGPRDSVRPQPDLKLEIDGLIEAAGCLYVVAGSTLGGRLIARALRQSLAGGVEQALEFFGGREAASSQDWLHLRKALDAHLQDPEDLETACRKAREVFRLFGRALADPQLV